MEPALPDHAMPDRITPPAAVPGHAADRPLSALPSRLARALAFAAVLLGGAAGGLIGYTLVRLQCSGECAVARGVGALAGAAVAALGMSVVATLVLRAMGEWRELDRQRRGRA